MKMADNDEIKIKTWRHLEDYASDGLRTLLLAKREIPMKEYERWAESYLVNKLYLLFNNHKF